METTLSKLRDRDMVFTQTPSGTERRLYVDMMADEEGVLGPRVSFGEKIWVWKDDFEKGEEAIFCGFHTDGCVLVGFHGDKDEWKYKHYCLLSRKPQEKVKPGDVIEGINSGRWLVCNNGTKVSLSCYSTMMLFSDTGKNYKNLGPFGAVYEEKPKA